ncbi:MAG TPA: hypothetical protein VGF23_05875 [Gaiellaceae bacterium]
MRLVPLALVAALLAGATPARAASSCTTGGASPAYAAKIERVLRSGRDVWGESLLRAPGGPTYAGARRFLPPLLLARGPGGRPLTDSGVYYLPFGQSSAVDLHVADGSQVIARRVGGRTLTVVVGRDGDERYGSCLARLAQPQLADGWLPILETRYTDASGTRYRQESFATRGPQSFVRLSVATGASAARVRFKDSNGSTIVDRVPAHSSRTIEVAWPRLRRTDTYDDARASVVDYWHGRLAEGMTIEVPEQRVVDAARAVTVQNLELTWRYSVGNPYEEFSFPESVDVAQVMSEWGFGAVARSILRASLTRRETPYPNWKKGEKLLGSAEYYRLFADRAFVDQVTPTLARYVASLGAQIAGGRAMLDRERFSSDIPDSVYGLHSQTVVWAGLRAIGAVWSQTGHPGLAATCARLAARLETGLRRAVAASQRRLPDGTLFMPVRLLGGEQPYDALTESRPASYWNLVMPYALASGFFAPRSAQAEGILRYMLGHGSRLLGLVRAGAFAIYGLDRVYPTSGTDQVYGINMARFLADNDQPDQLVLSLYGSLAAAMTTGTYVSGEGASVTPLPGTRYRAMYLPPNGASNAAFLETLRVMLVHERADGLDLAFSTPRAWLRPGRRIAVTNAPTSFGPVSFSIEAGASSAHVDVDVPDRAPLRSVRLRLRLPHATRTIEIPATPGEHQLEVGLKRRAS